MLGQRSSGDDATQRIGAARGTRDGRTDVRIDRRTLLTDLGRGVIGIALLGTAHAVHGAEPALAASSTGPATKLRWARADLGFVSAYVLARGKEAAVIDTGVRGSGPAIEQALRTLGLRYDAVRHVVLTHLHPDHAGSLAEVLAKAAKAKGYAGRLDVAGITSPRPLVALDGGASVFGLEVIATPGHTPGHICVLDHATGVLVGGDALGTAAKGAPVSVNGPNPRFSADMAAAQRSFAALAKEHFGVLLPGHGEPITADASVLVAAAVAAAGGGEGAGTTTSRAALHGLRHASGVAHVH